MIKLDLTAAMSAALPIIEQLERAGHETVFVGGAVRDTILGKNVKDVDIATAAEPEEVMAIFPRCIPTGLAHGTVTIMQEGIPYEVTTFRQEAQYIDFRKPSSVSFVKDLDGDLLRRDFTVNALALRGDGSIHDPYGGLNDLELGVLRCVGDANERLREDALRMVRAIRFIGVYGFQPALSVWRSIRRNRELLQHIAMERIQAELTKMIESSNPSRSLAWLDQSGLLRHTKEPLAFVNKYKESRRHPSGADILHEINEPDVKWTCLALSMGISATDTRTTLDTLRMSNKSIQRIVAPIVFAEQMADLLQYQNGTKFDSGVAGEWDKASMRLALSIGITPVRHWILITKLLSKNHANSMRLVPVEWINRLERLIEHAPVLTLKELDITGSELASALNKGAGAWLKLCLERLLLEASLGRIENQKEHLIQQAAAWETD
ncbi:CCA tRNA nucleotidyltransferase [Paenibacillus sp. strain BS8-2]